MSIAENVKQVRARIADAAHRAGRNPDDITLVAVSKNHPPEAVREAYAAGQRIFGENRIQEAVPKIEALADLPDISWHMIGHLQSNKAKKAVLHFDMIQSIDKMSTLLEVGKHAGKSGAVQDVLLEFNTGGEDSKNGMLPEKAAHFVRMCTEAHNIRIRGLMTLAVWSSDESIVRNCFRRLMDIKGVIENERPDLPLDIVSMGMSGDFEIAVEEGSTMVRVGTAIFGERNYEK